jgi:phospholipid/cholesterol/gamma-HCH transport system substrate-binding protein
MKQSRQTFWVGLFVLVGLGALAVLIILFGQYGLWAAPVEGNVIKIRFDRAPGIRPGTLVTAGGIEIGRVRRVGFVDPDHFARGVDVLVLLDEGYRVRQGCRAVAAEPGLGLGRPPIVILPGSPEAPVLEPGSLVEGQITPAVESLFPKAMVDNVNKTATYMGEAAAALTPVLDELRKILEARDPRLVDQPGGPPGNLASLIIRVDESAKHFNEVLGDPEVKSRIRGTVDNLHTMSEDGKAAVAELKEASADARVAVNEARALVSKGSDAVVRIDESAERLARSATEDLELVSRLLTQMNTVMEKVERGEGTMGRFVGDDKLYESLVLTFRRAAEAMEEFRLLVKEWQKGKIRVALF